MSGRPRRACHQCNAQKLRCIGAKPACERCKRLNRGCSWSDSTAARTHYTHSRRISLPPPSSPTVSINIPPTISDSSYIGIPSVLVLKLIDTFCSSLYSSSLLVHRTSLINDFNAKRAQPHLILSICALASSFYQNSDKANAFRDNGFSREWAEQAARLLFSEAEQADEAKVVSFTNLCLFWYGHGDWKRALVHEGNALIHLRLTSLSAKSTSGSGGGLSTELSNRRFWVAYVINQYVSEPTASFSEATIAKVRLPCREDQFETGALDDNAPNLTLKDDIRTPSIFAEVVRITALWSAVYKLIRDTAQDSASKLTAVNQLDARLRQWRDGLPACFSAVLDGNDTESDDRLRSALLILHIIYHQCVCALHASVVPLFSLRPSSSSTSSSGLANLYNQRLSAQMAYEHAGHISTLAQQVLARHPDDAFRWSGFVGFALYYACAIQLPFLWSTEVETAETVRGYIRADLETMAKTGRNWRYVLNLAVHVRRLYRYHSTDAVALPAAIYLFEERHLAGKYRQQHGSSQECEVRDYERSLARSETMHPDPTPSEHLLEECKELIEQASLSSCSPQTTEVGEASPTQAVDYYVGRATTISTTAATTTATAAVTLPTTTGWLASPPPSLFSEMNLYDIGEHEQLLFVQAMDDMQQGNECDTLEDWLRR